MIEKAPAINITKDSFELLMSPECQEAFHKVEKDYLYWDKAKYHLPKNIDPQNFWAAIELSRFGEPVVFNKTIFYCKTTTYMQQFLHEFDMNFGGTIMAADTISSKNKHYYLLSSIMEEAIASSQMEGANTTRRVAKDMLRKQAKPKNKDQQMIVNNYNTIRYLSEHKNEDLTPELVLEIHRRISEDTLENHEDEGRFRQDDNIVVMDELHDEIAHVPPTYSSIEQYIKELCDFANNDEKFIHPIVKAIIIHFMISYVHPFVDGNGRTARSLFYWYMLKKGYWLTEFLSISRIIYKSKGQYEKAFLYVESDNLNLGYFINYNLNVLQKAFDELKVYLNRKAQEEEALLEFRNIKGLNDRQSQIIKMALKKPNTVFLSKDLDQLLGASVKTIRSDLSGLVELGLFEVIPINQRLMGYGRVKNFEKKLEELGENSGN